VNEDAKATYNLPMIMSFLNLMSSESAVTVSYGTGMPIKIHVEYYQNGGYVDFYLAPRVQ
jgi:hypothetical protein